MARVDYFAIEAAIRDILVADAGLAGTTVLVEEELTVNRGNIVGIYLEDRDSPAEIQTLSAGTRTRFFVRFTIWCWHFGVGRNRQVPMEQRDDLVGKVEIALMGNRNLNGTVDSSWLLGGEFISGPDPTGRQFMSGASVILEVDVTGTT